MPLRLAITTLGCKVNQADADGLLRQLGAQVIQVPFDQLAQVYVINSCTVTATADRQSRQLVHRARRLNPRARVFLTGCLAAVSGPAGLADEVDGVFPLARHDELRDRILELCRQGSQGAGRAPVQERSRPFLKVQDGCDQACTYCIVPTARGPSRSTRTPAQIHAALTALQSNGYHEAVLTGIHLGHYGSDLRSPVSLAELLAGLTDPPAIDRLRLSSVEPLELDTALLELLERQPRRLCRHVHVPIQSGDDAVLAAMNRPYRAEQVQDLLRDLRARFPDAALGTDLIAGFPGETDRQFLRSLELVRAGPITHLHVFPYSRRPGTAAARMRQIPGDRVRERARLLREAGQAKLHDFALGQLGQVREALVERRLADGRLEGITDNYLRVRFVGPGWLVRRLAPVALEQVEQGRAGAALLRGRLAG